MTTYSIRLVADDSAVEQLIEELSRLAEELPDLRVEFGKLRLELAQIVQIDADLVPTVAALEYRLLLKPTDFLLALVTAARARDVQGVAQVIAAHPGA